MLLVSSLYILKIGSCQAAARKEVTNAAFPKPQTILKQLEE